MLRKLTRTEKKFLSNKKKKICMYEKRHPLRLLEIFLLIKKQGKKVSKNYFFSRRMKIYNPIHLEKG